MQIDSDNIVDITNVEYDKQGNCFIVMEYISGGDLLGFITSRNRLDEALARDILRQTASGLNMSHTRGIYHLDLKPENVLMDGCKPKLADYGTSLALDIFNIVATRGRSMSESSSGGSSISSLGSTVEENSRSGCCGSSIDLEEMEFGEDVEGSTAYLAPECSTPHLDDSLGLAVRDMLVALADGYHVTSGPSPSTRPPGADGQWSSRALAAIDVWGLGMTLYVMVAGYTPWNRVDYYNEDEFASISYPAWFSVELRNLLSKMLQVDPTRRATLRDVMNDPWLCRTSTTTIPSSPTSSPTSVFHKALECEVVPTVGVKN